MGQHRRGPTLTPPILQPKPQIVILKAFRALDTDRSGTIDYTEFSSVLKPWFEMTEVAAFSPVVHPPWVRSLSWEIHKAESRHAGVFASQDDCLDIFAKFDDDESGEITYDEFAEVSFSSSVKLGENIQRGAESVGLPWVFLAS